MQTNKKLQPKSFNGFIGQNRIVKTLKIMIKSAQNRGQNCDHILLYGRPGLGKTTLANLIAHKLKTQIKHVQGPLLEKKADILSLFATVESGDIIFIDEIHGINKYIEELLYSSLEEGVIDVPIGVDGETKFMRMKLPKFTMIGATTKLHSISNPLKDRFGLIAKMNNYTNDEIEKILKNSSKRLDIKIQDEEIKMIANYSGLNPRKANTLLKRCFDFNGGSSDQIEKKVIIKTFKMIGVYKGGLNDQHLEYLKLMKFEFNSSWTSLDTISGALLETKGDIERNIETDLILLKYICKSSRGRKITQEGENFLRNYSKIN